MSQDKSNHYVLCLAHGSLLLVGDMKFLSILMQHKKDGPDTAQGWNFNGGHVKEDETPQQAAQRELLEESGIDTDVGAWDMLDSRTFDNGIRMDTMIYALTPDEAEQRWDQTDKGRPLRFVEFHVELGMFPRPMGDTQGPFAESVPHLISLAVQHLLNPDRRLASS